MPLGLFFLSSTKYDFFVSTTIMMVATAVSLIATWWLFRQLALMAIITAVTSLVAGSVTLIWDDPVYVLMKPTIVGGIFAAILLAALILDKPLFRVLLGQNLQLTDQGWRVLTWLWFGYFVFISGLNEFIWRSFSWQTWAAFKAFGLMPMTILFAIPQIYLLKRFSTAGAEPYAFGSTIAASNAEPRPAEATVEGTTP